MTNRLKRLELTWIGKDDRPRLEPRILLEDPELSYAKRVSNDDLCDNRLIHGDNLLALKALEQEFAGKVKCIYIDPPYNTGSAFAQYDDGVEHSLWLSLMRDRIELLSKLLRDDGSIWISIDDNEAHYLKVLCDEVFGRANFVANMIWEKRTIIGALSGGAAEVRLEDYVVRGLIDFDDVSYDEQADLLYKLAGQVVAHLRGYLKDEDEVRNVLVFHAKQIANLVHALWQPHAWEEASSYETVVRQGFSEVRSQAFAAPAGEVVRQYDTPIDNKIDIRRMLFGGFKKCLYPTQKFDSDTERRFTVIIEKDKAVIKWFKPGKGVFQIRYCADADYEPDFVVETETEKLICEPKGTDRMQDSVVLAKARAAAMWCKHATAHETANNGKPWRYMLIPHDVIADNMTVAGLAKTYTVEAPEEGRS